MEKLVKIIRELGHFQIRSCSNSRPNQVQQKNPICHTLSPTMFLFVLFVSFFGFGRWMSKWKRNLAKVRHSRSVLFFSEFGGSLRLYFSTTCLQLISHTARLFNEDSNFFRLCVVVYFCCGSRRRIQDGALLRQVLADEWVNVCVCVVCMARFPRNLDPNQFWVVYRRFRLYWCHPQ